MAKLIYVANSSLDGYSEDLLDEDVTQTFYERVSRTVRLPACSPETEMPAAGFAPAGIGQTEYVDS